MVVTISFKADIDNNALEEITKATTNHLDWLLDLESYPEIKSVFDGTVKVEEV